MRCPGCGSENRPAAKYCTDCGRALARICPSCQAEQPLQARFCDSCGSPLEPPHVEMNAAGRADAEEAARQSLLAAERRQLTVMFCDLVGSTALSENLDPEDYREWIQSYRDTCAEIVRRFDGRIARFVGDGTLIYFGYPHAHEDDAHRAVRAGLGIVDAMQELNSRFREHFDGSLEVRIGVHTGLAVVGEVGKGETLEPMASIGETPNVAARMQMLAHPNEIVMSAATYRLTEGFFSCEPLGRRVLKGIREPMEVYRAFGESGVRSRLDAVAGTELTPLVGREREGALLYERWRRVKDGAGQVVLLCGEAGIGKSRLVRTLHDFVSSDTHEWWEARCSTYFQDSALYPVAELFQKAFGLEHGDAPEVKFDKLEQGLACHVEPNEAVPLFGPLLSVRLPERYTPPELTPEQRKQRIFDLMLAYLRSLSERAPVAFVVEDIHWIDPSTLELLALLAEQAPTLRIMLVLTFRPGFAPEWAMSAHFVRIDLERLTPAETERLVENVTRGKAIPPELLARVVTSTDGVPLYVEEVTKMELESGLLRETERGYELTGPLPQRVIPASLHDSLLARLDSLSTAKPVVQLCATLGRDFSFELLSAIAPFGTDTLERELERLVGAELLVRQGTPPHASYTFKHALLQETAYESMLRSTRQRYHGKIFDVIVERFPETVDARPELMARHCTEAGLVEEAIRYWKLAGERATALSANLEAISHLRNALALVEGLDDPEDRARQELALLTALGVPLTATRGYAHEEVEQVYVRARDLSIETGETEHLYRAHSGMYRCYVTRGELLKALDVGERLYEIATRAQSSDLMVEAERAYGATLASIGRLQEARTHLEHGIAVYDPDKHASHAMQYSGDPGLSCRLYLVLPLWQLGLVDRAVGHAEEALTQAHRQGLPFGLAFANLFVSRLYACRREWARSRELAEACIRISIDQKFMLWQAAGEIFRGRALAENDDLESGIAQMEHGLAAYRKTGASLAVPHVMYLMAEIYAKASETNKALARISEGKELMERHQDRFWEAELYRLEGELLLSQGKPVEEAAERFERAAAVAGEQGARSLELRACMSIARLNKRRGEYERALARLKPVYDAFEEGFDTPDLVNARTLVEELTRLLR